jgi:hypothetical protein
VLEETGKGIADRGKALREAKLKAIEQEAEFNFRREMADKQISADNARTDKTIAADDRRVAATQEGENTRLDKTIAAGKERTDAELAVSGDIVTGEDGHTYQKTAKGLKRTTDADGNPIDVSTTKAGESTAEMKNVEFLVANGIAPDVKTAWKMVKSAGDDNKRASLITSVYNAMKSDLMGRAGKDDATIQKEAVDFVDGLLKQSESVDTTGNEPAGASAGGIPAPKDRKIGQKYTNPNGVTATWTKDGWVY